MSEPTVLEPFRLGRQREREFAAVTPPVPWTRDHWACRAVDLGRQIDAIDTPNDSKWRRDYLLGRLSMVEEIIEELDEYQRGYSEGFDDGHREGYEYASGD